MYNIYKENTLAESFVNLFCVSNQIYQELTGATACLGHQNKPHKHVASKMTILDNSFKQNPLTGFLVTFVLVY